MLKTIKGFLNGSLKLQIVEKDTPQYEADPNKEIARIAKLKALEAELLRLRDAEKAYKFLLKKYL